MGEKEKEKKNYFLLLKNMEMKEMPTPKKAKKKYHWPLTNIGSSNPYNKAKNPAVHVVGSD